VIQDHEVFEAVRRGYSELELASNSDILDYFSSLEVDSVTGHINHVKGILFEQEYIDALAEKGIEAEIFEVTNHPGTDIQLLDGSPDVTEFQLKATDSVSYINTAMTENPETAFVVTSEVAANFEPGLVIDSEIENSSLEEAVSETLLEEVTNPVSPLSVVGWFFGLPF